MTSPIRVFIGHSGDPIYDSPEAVLKDSILRTTDAEVEFYRCGVGKGITGFSTGRWHVPALCDYKGFAIYLDVDMYVYTDIQELWNYRKDDAWCITPVGTSVSVIDCSAFRLPLTLRPKDSYRAIMNGPPSRYTICIPATWNQQDRDPRTGPPGPGPTDAGRGVNYEPDWEIPPETDLFHWTTVEWQPWRETAPKHRVIDKVWLDYEAALGLDQAV